MNLTVVSVSSTEPVTTQEVGDWLRVDSDQEDDTLSLLITTARQSLELWTRRAIVPTTFRLGLDRFPWGRASARCESDWMVGDGRGSDYSDRTLLHRREIRLPRPPLVAVSSITYVDTAGATQTLDASAYQVDAADEPARIVPAYATFWPTARHQPNAVQVTYTAGYATPAAVPATIRTAMRLLIGGWYENRESVGVKLEEQPMAVRTFVEMNTAAWEW
jgi:hypothetical protein